MSYNSQSCSQSCMVANRNLNACDMPSISAMTWCQRPWLAIARIYVASLFLCVLLKCQLFRLDFDLVSAVKRNIFLFVYVLFDSLMFLNRCGHLSRFSSVGLKLAAVSELNKLIFNFVSENNLNLQAILSIKHRGANAEIKFYSFEEIVILHIYSFQR